MVIVAMGSALLLGPGFAAANTVQKLDAMGGPTAVTYAAETLTADKDATGRTNSFTPADIDNVTSQGRTTHYALISPDEETHVLVVKPARRIESTETLFLRLDLTGGMVLNGETVTVHQGERTADAEGVDTTTYTGGAIASATTAGAAQTAGGMAGDSYAVFRISGQAIALNASIWIRVDHALAVPMGTGSYDASISAYTNADDAVAGLGAGSTISGEGTIVRVASGLDASVTAGDPLEAAVATGFRWFNGGSPFRAQAQMGLFQAIANPMGVLSANDGLPAMDADIISMNEGSVMVTVEGDLSIGAFSVVNYNAAVMADPGASPPSRPWTHTMTPAQPDRLWSTTTPRTTTWVRSRIPTTRKLR